MRGGGLTALMVAVNGRGTSGFKRDKSLPNGLRSIASTECGSTFLGGFPPHP